MDTVRWRIVNLSLFVGIAALLMAQYSSASTVKYCATYNTGSTSANYSVYQSNGLCDSFCDGYAYAILQDSACWCSDYTPAGSTTVDLDDCDGECPGYPDDDCGNLPDYYLYIFKDISPEGTKGPSSSSSSTLSSSTAKITSSRTSAVISTITSGTQVQTVTLFPDNESGKSGGDGLSTGAAVGIAVGVIIFVLGIGGLVFFLWWKKRKQRLEAEEPSPRSSSAGMIGAMADMSETGQQNSARRGSKFIPIDDRMEFHHGLYVRNIEGGDNRESVDSLRDDVDYSRRVLRTTNPDPPAHD